MKPSLMDAALDGLELPENAAVLDVGCRDARTLTLLKARFPRCGKQIGIDKRGVDFEPAEEQRRLGVRLIEMDAAAPDFPDGSFDLIFHKNTLECIPDIPAHLRELHRLLKPGGRVVCIHGDWESIVLNGGDKRLIRKAVLGYANFLQSGWMDSCDGWIGRRLWGYFQSSGLFDGTVGCYSSIETEYREGMYGWRYVREMGQFPFLTAEEYRGLLADMRSAADRRAYLFSLPYYIYKGRKL